MTAEPTPGARLRVLALMPSLGLGGGIESYFVALEEALLSVGADVDVISLRTTERREPTLRLKARFAARAVTAARRLAAESNALVLVLHPGLFPVGVLVRKIARLPAARCVVFFYGTDIWGHTGLVRRVAHRTGWKVVTISSFSAGGLVSSGPVVVLPPGIPRSRYERLVGIASAGDRASRDVDVLSVFRLDEADGKGASVLVAAGDMLRRRRALLSMVIAGSGRASSDLRHLVAERADWLELKEDLSFDELADLYGRARLFVLASRSHRPGRSGFCGEGFGIVLVEAQLAGTPVIAPHLGGSSDAFVNWMTGVRPTDDSPETLAATIERILDDDLVLKSMAEDAASWSRGNFAPESYIDRVRRSVLADRA